MKIARNWRVELIYTFLKISYYKQICRIIICRVPWYSNINKNHYLTIINSKVSIFEIYTLILLLSNVV